MNHHDAPAIIRQVSAMEVRWQRFLSRMEDHRAMLEASIEYHQLYEQVCYQVIMTVSSSIQPPICPGWIMLST